METQNCLGIYLRKDAATAVCLSSKGLQGCFSVTIEAKDDQTPQTLARLIAEGCAKRELKFSESALALDCSMFMQHNVHSKFSDHRQIASTIRFDAEEVLGMDITELALAFKVMSGGPASPPREQAGSSLTVFTADKKLLAPVLASLQSNNIDPVTIEPDANCLSGFILQKLSLPQDELPCLFCVLSESNGYFIAFDQSRQTLAMRTFLVRPTQDRFELLAREVPVTTALINSTKPVNSVKIFDSTGSVDYQQLGSRLGIKVGSVDLIEASAAAPETLADCTDRVGFATAYGAALSLTEKGRGVNFRSDFSPYQGRKVRLQKAVKFAGISVTVLALAAGIWFQMQLWQENRYRSQLRKKLEKDYATVMFGKKPPAKTDPAKKLEGELRRIENVKKGLLSVTGEQSISAKLTLVLDAFNKCAGQTGLNVDSISVTTKTINITGDTSSRPNTLKLFEAIKSSGLDILQQDLSSKGGRDNFSITIDPKK